MRKILFLMVLLLLAGGAPLFAQKKPVQTNKTGTTKKPAQKKPATTTSKTAQLKSKAGVIPANKIDTFKLQVIPLVKFFESTLNFLADKRNPVNQKQTIITESYLKFTWDSEVQVEDDLDNNRLVPLYKDMPAYLSDVDFFFKRARFTYTLQDLSVQANELGQTYFKVTANRNLNALTLNGDSVNSNMVRYIEINYDETKQQLKIVSIYTTKLNEKDDLRNWWNSMSNGWRMILGKDLPTGNGINMAQVESYNDTTALINGARSPIDGGLFYRNLNQIVNLQELDLSGNVNISDLSPLAKMSALKRIDISGTPVSDLMPLRNMNNLEVLNISGTEVSTLEPLRYCTHLRELKMKDAQISDISLLANIPALELLDISYSPVKSLDAISGVTPIRDLRLRKTSISDLTPLSDLTNIELLDISSTPVQDISPLKNMSKLMLLLADSTRITSLDALANISALQKVYCDNTKITPGKAFAFIQAHPSVSLIYESQQLQKWWSTMPPEWQKVFFLCMTMNSPPTTEQLHKLVLTDSININGRAQIASLSPLNQLTRLRVLYCTSSGITAFDPLKDLDNLETIQAANTKVNSLQPLSNLKRLTLLNIDNTSITDLDPLYKLDKLQLVFADNTQVNLQEANAFYDNNQHCMLIFQTFENTNWWKNLLQAWKDVLLGQLNLKGQPDKIQLQQIANLDKVVITENFQISDLMPLQKLSRLTELQFSGTTVSKLDPISTMNKLVVLRCPKNPVFDLSPVNALPKLKELDFSNTQVEDLMPIQNMIQLEVLKFSGTPVKNLKYLQKLVYLKVIELYNTKVSNLDVLEGMRNLTSIKIFNTKISEKRVMKFKETHPNCEVVFY